MPPIVEEVFPSVTPRELVEILGPCPGVALLESTLLESRQGRHSFVTAQPFLTFRAHGSRCVVVSEGATAERFGNPWHQLDELMADHEMLDELDLPFPAGGCFGYWGYDLKNFVEPKLGRRAVNDLELPDCALGFYGSLVVFDHRPGKTWIVATGLPGRRHEREALARREIAWWKEQLGGGAARRRQSREPSAPAAKSSMSKGDFLAAVARAQHYIRHGHIYQVNLSHRLTVTAGSGWDLYRNLAAVSPAPFAAYFHFGDFELVSSSPELFLRMSGSRVLTRPIKGTRPRDADPERDARLAEELKSSQKEQAELVMITDLLRNDLGRVCAYGTIQVPELAALERYAQVQHLVSTVEGELRPGVTHFQAFASCFPGGSVTGAPKFRAMQIIDELEPVSRGPYTGALGYLGFNRESQLSIVIRSAIHKEGKTHFHAGAGIVADSVPSAEYDETLAKASGFLQALRMPGALRH
jgi:para-aminobenzoate synthetase component I